MMWSLPLFLRQFSALLVKNWIVLSKHPILNILRCFILPIAYGVFLAVAQKFLMRQNNLGLGTAVPIPRLVDEFDGSLKLVWADATRASPLPQNVSSSLTADNIMAEVTSGFSPAQLRAVHKVNNVSAINPACPQNFNGFSECFGAIEFRSIAPTPSGPAFVQYAIRSDIGLYYINVERHTSDFEERVLPLQWAVDQAIIKLHRGVEVPTPLELPFTQQTNEEQAESVRRSYVRGLRTLLVLTLFIDYIGIAYQLPGACTGERANLLTSHMKAMGLLDSARIASWIISISLAYFPAWVIVSITWAHRIFSESSVGLIVIVHLVTGISLASWSIFVAVPFGKSPQLAAIVSTVLSMLFAVFALVLGHLKTGAATIFTLAFPPSFYVFAIRAICGFENNQIPTNVFAKDPDNHLTLFPMLVAAIINIFLWPYLAALWERRLYDAREPSTGGWFSKSRTAGIQSPAVDTAISIRNVRKTFSTSLFGRTSGLVTAISDLSFDVPKFGIFVLLGSNGAGKSTVLSILGGLLSRTSGTVAFEGGASRPPRGTIGIVPQKNVLFPELTCYQTLRVWRAVKWSENSVKDEDLVQMLRDCDLQSKIYANAGTLSGGQKRKLQLAIGLVGGSKIVLVDECTSGIDPLSRRAVWRTLIAFRNDRTIVFTTHFLDEADLLADHIAVLAIPGKLVANGSPVALKRDLGSGYTVQVTFNARAAESESEQSQSQAQAHLGDTRHEELLRRICTIAPEAQLSESAPQRARFRLRSKDSGVVERVLRLIESESVKKSQFGIGSYDVLGSSIEEVFLDLMIRSDESISSSEKPAGSENSDSAAAVAPAAAAAGNVILEMTSGRQRNPLAQALTICHKRMLILRRSWLAPLLMVLITVIGCCVPLFFMKTRVVSCTKKFSAPPTVPLNLPDFVDFWLDSAVVDPVLYLSPPEMEAVVGPRVGSIPIRSLADNESFLAFVESDHRDLALGGVSFDLRRGAALVAWEADPPGMTGPALLNLASNVLLNGAFAGGGAGAGVSGGSNASAIGAVYRTFPYPTAGTLFALKWAGFFGLAMAVFPAFFALYVARERHSSVQAMQLSNGLSNPVGLWLGHLLFDTGFTILLATIVTIVFATASNQFHGLAYFWFVMILYGIVGALFSYCVALVFKTPLAAFAAVAAYQAVMFMLYVAGYLLTLTYAKPSSAARLMKTIHFSVSVASPVASVMRACLVSVNLFSLLCSGETPVSPAQFGEITRYGGPIAYLIVYGMVLFGVLVWVDSGSSWRWWRRLVGGGGGISRRLRRRSESREAREGVRRDVVEEAEEVGRSDDLLRVLGVSKVFGRERVVEDVSFGVGRDTIFALLGPNGAGKTTTFNIIRGNVVPNEGDVVIDGVSVVRKPRSARIALGVCPQFTAIDSQLTVREHLVVYGRLKGLVRKGGEVERNVEVLMRATGLDVYADRLASKLSGGNQRKLALAIALIGNPSVVLIDEFSTGIDAKMKREMWVTLRNVAVGKAIVITTHSMEEASALANKVGIMAKRMLSVGTTAELSARYGMYEVHISCRSREDVVRARELMARIPGSRMADDVATRFEVPIGEGMSLVDLFRVLAEQGGFSEYTVEKAGLESLFLKVIRENDVAEEDGLHRARCCGCF